MLRELVEQELVAVSDVGPPRRYRVLDTHVLGAASVLGGAGQLAHPSKLAT